MAQRNSRHTELSDSLSETKSVPSAPSDKLTTTSSDSHSQLSVATPSPLPVVSNQECVAISNTLKAIPKPPASPSAQKITVSTAVGPSPPREVSMQEVNQFNQLSHQLVFSLLQKLRQYILIVKYRQQSLGPK